MVAWTLNPLVAIGITLGVMFFGYFFGLSEGRGQGYKKRRKEEAEDTKHQPLLAPLPLASPPASSDEIPMLDVSMTLDGQLHLKMDGQQMDTSALDAEQRKRLIAILTQMRPWLEVPQATQPKPAPASTPSLSSRPAPPPSPASRPSFSAPAIMTPPVEEDNKPATPLSIVAQIDSVLQARLAGTPLAEKGIRLQESLEAGVIVWVGVSKYESVDDVPDEQIKAALRAAIAEWENKYTPGL